MKSNFEALQTNKVDGDKLEIDGAYWFKHPSIRGYVIQVIASTGMGWDHVSVSLLNNTRGNVRLMDRVDRCPTWAEMCHVKDLFFDPSEVVIQYHPSAKDYVNRHPFCLHLWKPQGIELPTPNTIMV